MLDTTDAYLYKAVIEIAPLPGGALPGELIARAYESSEEAPVMLVLNHTRPTDVDRMLDPIVARLGIKHCGVVYVDAADDDAILRAARSAQRVFAATPGFRARLATLGVTLREPLGWTVATTAAFGG